MSAPKHTPGPWRVGISKHTVYQVAAPELRIALCSDLEEKGGREAEKANARLIAAAPDLLEALRLQRCSQCTPSEPDEDVCDACRARRAAIAKAEGRK